MQGNQAAEDTWERMTRQVAMVTAAFIVAYTVWYLLWHSDFTNDDLDYLVIMQHTGFWQFVLAPADVHYAPLHEVLTWLIYHISPMNFAVAVVVLMIFHIGTLIYLACSLRLLNAGQASGLIVCGYAACSLIVAGLAWWAHAEQRVPYVFLDVCAIYHYLAWLRSGRGAHLWIAALAFLAALGFYEKAVLIPFHMLVIGYLSDEARFRTQLRKTVWPLMLFALGSAAFILAYLHFLPASGRAALPVAIRADLEFVKVLLAAAAGLGVEAVHDVPIHGLSFRLAAVLLLLCAMFGWSLWRGRGSWKILPVMLLVLLFDYLPIAVSNRVAWYGLELPREYRYHYEELQLVALFVGIWCARVAAASVPVCRRKLVWLTGFTLLVAYAAINTVNSQMSRLKPLSWLWVMDHSHIYLEHLREDLAGIRDQAPVFENDKLPRYLTLFGFTPDTRTLLPLFEPNVRFDDAASPRYKVLQDGHIERAR